MTLRHLEPWAAFGIDPRLLRRTGLSQGLLNAGIGLLTGRNWQQGLGLGLAGFQRGQQDALADAMRQATFGFSVEEMKRREAEAAREAERFELDKAATARDQSVADKLLAQFGGGGAVGGSTALTAPPSGPGGAIRAESLAPMGGFDRALRFVLGQEGGYVANDAGAGPTNFGINSRANPDVDVANLTPQKAAAIYKTRYWDAIGGDSLPSDLALVAFDTAVNQGVGVAKQFLSQSGGDIGKFLELRQSAYERLGQNPELADALPTWTRRMGELSTEVAGDGSATAPVAAPGAPLDLPEGRRLALQVALMRGDLAGAQQILAGAGPPAAPETHGNLEWDSRAGAWRPIQGYQPVSPLTGLRVDENGNVTLSRAGTTDVEKRRINAGEAMTRLTNIEAAYKPEYQTYGSAMAAGWSSLKAKAGVDLDPPQKQFLIDFVQYKRRSIENLNLTIKELTGAAMTEAEANRIRMTMPDPGTGLFDGDDPVTFKANLDDALATTKMAIARYNYMLTRGLDTTAPDVSLDQMTGIMNARGDEIEAEMREANPNADPDMIAAEVDAQLATEFGLQ